ncbi:MAG TPA: potassium/proton antiporter [Thermoanaerobaculia bacterium]|jgi:cell volume regulation protein A|nr:potassium/proton antiporter [Thermoanaerobaculia bacterium]
MTTEPFASAWVLLGLGILLGLSALSSRLAGRSGLPITLLLLGVGMLAGEEGLGGLAFEDYSLSFRLGALALVLILFDGGLNTPISSVKKGLAPAATLATLGVLGTAAIIALGAWLLGFEPARAALLGAVVSSTDAAAVFSTLRAGGIRLPHRLGAVLEIESGLNDPMAVILTTALTAVALGSKVSGWHLALEIPVQLAVGAGLGLVIGRAGRWLLRRARLKVSGLYPALTVALALLAFSLPTLFFGSGFLAVYVAAIILGDGKLPHRGSLLRVHDAIAWFAQIGMFLLLGLLVFPSRLLAVAPQGLALALLLAFVARPLVVFLLLLPFRFPRREALFLSWTGLRGAVPIVLATFPVMARLPGGREIFDVVFFVTVVNAVIPGATIAAVARRLGLAASEPPAPEAVVEIHSARPLEGETLSFYIEEAVAVCGASIADLPIPESTVILLVVRGNRMIAPRGSTVLVAGDHVHLFCKAEDAPLLGLLFGRPEE